MTLQPPKRTSPSLVAILSLMLLCLVVAVAFAELYAGAQRMATGAPPEWLLPAIINSVLSLVVLIQLARSKRLQPLLSRFGISPLAPLAANKLSAFSWLIYRPWLAYLPAVIVVASVAMLIALGKIAGGAVTHNGEQAVVAFPWAWVIWIPLVEELVFRVGIGQAFRRRGGVLWGSWFSALAFALIHASPTLERLTSFNIGLPVGPFLLGLACEALFVATGRLWPIVLLHAACNATVPLFMWGDERWLNWLSFLYN